jgi:GDP-D-mannose dehydratase
MVKINKSALICGVSGQDGTYLSKLLLDKGIRFMEVPETLKVQILKT